MTSRPLILVACGVLINAQGQVLLAERPAGKYAAGKWEFPGGKIEPGETARDALRRELHEELGVVVEQAAPLLRFQHAYSDRDVVLDCWSVTAWSGIAASQEGQRLLWRLPAEIRDLDVLPTVAPILRALGLPPHYVFTPPHADARFLRAHLAALPRGALLRLRRPNLADGQYAALARAILPDCRAADLRLMLDRAPALCQELGAAGWHATSATLMQLKARPLPPNYLVAASVHAAVEYAAAQRLGLDCAVLGPIKPTPTHPEAAGIGWPGFAVIRQTQALPLYALGGLGPADLEVAQTQGARGIAGISAYW
jgi:8-oxo-dGTP diphosphatase